jgi:hypothetical protein
VIHDAYYGEFTIFLNHYEIELDSSNDNVVSLVVDNEDNTST